MVWDMKEAMPAFSLVNGGPVYHLVKALDLVGARSWRVAVRAGSAALLAWAPPVALACAQGLAKEQPGSPLYDAQFHVRFLFAVPLLVVAGVVVDRRLSEGVSYLANAELVTEAHRSTLDSAVAKMNRLRDSFAELALLPTAYLLSWWSYNSPVLLGAGSAYRSPWARSVAPGVDSPSLAGWWHFALSLPLLYFLFLLWVWRLTLWTTFLWWLSRGLLQIYPTHPDNSGGLGFVAIVHDCFAIVVLAASASAAAAMASNARLLDVPMLTFRAEAVAIVVAMPVLFWIPLLVFTPLLLRSRDECLRRYAVQACEYSRRFEEQSIQSGAPLALDNQAIQTDNNLGGSFERVQKMRPVLFDKRALLLLLVAAGAPMLVLLVQEVPLRNIARQVVKLIG
jgi:hypothetical protein